MACGVTLCVALLALSLASATSLSSSQTQSDDLPVDRSNGVYSQERKRRDSTHSVSPTNSSVETTICPTWFRPNPPKMNECICSDRLRSEIYCDNANKEVYLARSYCMTYNETMDEFFLGSCPFNYYHNYSRGLNVKLPQNRSELNDFMCGGLKREGKLCGKCEAGYGVSLYSIQRRCTPCSGSTGWGWYIFVDFISQTIFFLILFVSKVSVTSPALNAFVLYAQISTTVDVNALYSAIAKNPEVYYLDGIGKTCLFLLNIWKLEFFTLVAPPECLIENLSSLGAFALRYVSAFYPLFLIFLLYLFVRIRDRNWKPVVTVWKPFQKCRSKLKQYYKLDRPITKAFATIFLLSYVRITDVSYSLLLPSTLYTSNEEKNSTLVWYYDANIVLFSREHVGYGLLALTILFTYTLIPPLLLFLYPFGFFQKCLRKLRLSWSGLKIFMDVMQCHYKDGLDGTRDLRSFSALYFWVRFIFIVIRLLSVYHGWHYTVISLLFAACALLVLLLRPYKKQVFNYIDCLFLTLLAVEFHIYFLVIIYSALSQVFVSSLFQFFLFLGFSPVFYFFLYVLYHLFHSIKFPEKWKAAVNVKWLRAKKALLPVSSRRYSVMSQPSHSDDLELPDRCVRPELYDSFLMTNTKVINEPATI